VIFALNVVAHFRERAALQIFQTFMEKR